MGIAKMLLRTIFHILFIIVLFIVSNFLVYPITMLKEKIGEHPGQVIVSSLLFITFMLIHIIRILRDNDLHRDITAIINKSDKEYSLSNIYFEYMKKYGIKELICFMTAMLIINLLYLNINTSIDNIMNEVFIFMYNIFKFIYSSTLPLGSFSAYIILNYVLVVVLFSIIFSATMCYIITKCEENRLHKAVKK